MSSKPLQPRVTFTYLSDPGRAWLIVPPQWIVTVELNLSAFSGPSRVDNDGMLALEEDQDAKTFMKAYERKFGETHEVCDVFEPRAQVRDWLSLQQMAA